MPAGRDADQERRPYDQAEDSHRWRWLGSDDQEKRRGEQKGFDSESSGVWKSSGGTRRDPAPPQPRRCDREHDAEDGRTGQSAPTLPSPHAETDQHAKLCEEPDCQERQHWGSVRTGGSLR